MGHGDRSLVQSATLRQEIQRALLGTALRFGDALQRLQRHQRACGYDHSCCRLLDEVRLSRSLLLVLAEECSREFVSHRATGRLDPGIGRRGLSG